MTRKEKIILEGGDILNPKSYCQEHNIPTREFIAKVKEIAPKYSKETHCMASNPDYGVCLRPVVVRHIKGKPEHRVNPCRIQFRCTAAQKERLTRAMDVMSYATMQDLMTFLVNAFLSGLEKETERRTA